MAENPGTIMKELFPELAEWGAQGCWSFTLEGRPTVYVYGPWDELYDIRCKEVDFHQKGDLRTLLEALRPQWSSAGQLNVRAKICMLKPEYGGRRGSFDAGHKYRPNILIEGAFEEHGAAFDFEGEPIAPGDVDRVVTLRFIAPELVRPKIVLGGYFQIREGRRTVGVGVFL